MSHIKLIIFDLDGTLVNAYPAITASFNYTMRRIKYPLKDALTIRRAVGRGDKNLLKPFIKNKDLNKALAIYRKHHKKALLKKSSLLPGTRVVLEKLKNKGYKLAIATNRPSESTLILIRHLELDKYFDYVICADSLKFAKPHPKILNEIMRKFLVGSYETLFVGDMTIDARTGKKAGVKTVIVTTGSSSKEEIYREKPYYKIMNNITELLSLV
ncbi:MAG: HAD family hydrolase [Candidatus Omnitrophica bacterium]|nr:HAD family hydrolase [Candidatus Omnitrophota bacterium]